MRFPVRARLFTTVGVAIVRTRGLMATVTAYGYKAPANWLKSKYMARPTGGCVSNLYFDGYGHLQVASGTRYRRWEPLHFPELGDPRPLSPRIEEVRGDRVWSSLNEFDGRIALELGGDPVVSTKGVVRDETGRAGSVRYEWRHTFGDRWVRKEAIVGGGLGASCVRIVEPVIEYAGTIVERVDHRTIAIRNSRGTFRLRVEAGEVEIAPGGKDERVWWPLPALLGRPITIELGRLGIENTVRYMIERIH